MHTSHVPRQISAVTHPDFKVTGSPAWQRLRLRRNRPGLGCAQAGMSPFWSGQLGGTPLSVVPIQFGLVFQFDSIKAHSPATLENMRGWLVNLNCLWRTCWAKEIWKWRPISRLEMAGSRRQVKKTRRERGGCLTFCPSVVERKPRPDSVSSELVWTVLSDRFSMILSSGWPWNFLKSSFS